MTPIAAMVAKMLAAGLPHDAIVLAVETAETVSAPQKSADFPQTKLDISAEKRRAADRERQAEIRRNRQISADKSADAPRTSLLLPSSTSSEKEKDQERKKEREAAGTRLSADWVPTESDLAFARLHGRSEPTIEVEAIKFRNYWVSKTGRNATKRNWTLTWQNWILNAREAPRAGPHRNGKPTISEACDNLLDKLNALDRAPEIRDAAGQTPVRLLPPQRRQ